MIVLRRSGYWPVVGIALALLGAGAAGTFYRNAQAVKAAAEAERRAAQQAQAMAEREIAAAVKHVQLTSEQAVQAELQAREVAEAKSRELERVRREMEAMRLEGMEKGRREAMEQARLEAEEQPVRLLTPELAAARAEAAPGQLQPASLPTGGGGQEDVSPMSRAPLSIEGLPSGRDAAKPTLPEHFRPEATVDSVALPPTGRNPVALERATGAVAVSSLPAESEFSIRLASTSADAEPLRRGRTPALLDDLPVGEYVVRFSQAGWADRSERVVIEGGATVRVATAFQGGTVMINSSPTGASVLQGGLVLGKTPLTLGAVPPQEVTYELRAHGYEPLKVSGNVEDRSTLELNGTLKDLNRLAGAEEVRTSPRPYLTTPLSLGRIPRSTPPYITASFVVLLDGSLEDITIVETIDRKLARKAVEEIAQWKFYPAVSHAGYPVKLRMSMRVRIAGR